MTCAESDTPWATLTPLYGEDRDPIALTSEVFTIGRHPSCDLKLTAKAVSSCHCTIVKNPDGKVVLQDTSTNGTVIDGETKVKQEVHDLQTGSELYLVFRRNSSTENVVFLFELTTDASLERTQPLEEQSSIAEEALDSGSTSRQTEESVKGKATKRPAADEDSEASCSKASRCDKAGNSTEDSEASCAKASRCDEAGSSTEEDRGMLDTLICAICQEILHDCVSVQPCLHSFCAGCFSDWMQPSCPSCRQNATRVAKNHLVNNIVEEFLKRNPDRRRSKEDLEDLDKKNKIKKELVFNNRSFLSGNSSDSDGSPPPIFSLPIPMPVHVPRPVCRQCPNYPPVLQLNAIDSAFDFTCDPYSTVHVLCQCCLRPMPKRTEPDMLVKQQCAVCCAFFCAVYFGCVDTCRGCLRQLKETSLSGLCEDAILNSNPYESRVLLDYLQEQNLSLQTLLAECAENLQSHRFYTPATPANVSGESYVCRPCGQRQLREFAYHYRASIAADLLPERVRNRPNCYWGRRCRTQIRMHHAERYNHICEQTRNVE